MAEHALLSASGAKKWLTCTPSARYEETFPNEESDFATEGTKCHELLEIVAKHRFHGIEPLPCPVTLEDGTVVQADLKTTEGRRIAGFNQEMDQAVHEALTLAMSITEPLRVAGKPFLVFVEERVRYDWIAPEAFGTCDLVIATADTLHVIDLKYGKGVAVDSEDNPQLKLYGLGAWENVSFDFDTIETVSLSIVQPRINNTSTWSLPLADLLAWGESVKPIAKLAFAGEGEFVPGNHCSDGFCRARGVCRARADYLLAAFDPKSPSLTDDQIAEILPKLDQLVTWANDLKSDALKRAVAGEATFKGYKLVEGRSNRYIADKKTAQIRLVANGYMTEEFMTEPKMLGLTALTELVGGKAAYQELLGDITLKPEGEPTLAPVSDKRKEWKPKASAEEDFGD